MRKLPSGESAFGWIKVIAVLIVIAILALLLWKLVSLGGDFGKWLREVWDKIVAKLKSFNPFGMILSVIPSAQAGTNTTTPKFTPENRPNADNKSPFLGLPDFGGDDWTSPRAAAASLDASADATENSECGSYRYTTNEQGEKVLSISICGAG